MRYEEFISLEDLTTFHRVKKMQMTLARVSREVIVELLKPDVVSAPTVRSGKEFLRTSAGLFRLANRPNSDNTTEEAAHDAAGAKYIDMSDDKALQDFFDLHPKSGTVTVTNFKDRVRKRLAQNALREAGPLKITKVATP